MSKFRYTNKDFDSLKAEMLSKVPVLAPAWTNLNEGDLGMALINLVAGIGDMLAYYLDRYAEEVYLPTALDRNNIQKLVRLIDYRLSRPRAAVTTLRFSLEEAASSNVVIPKYTVCKTADGLQYVTKEDATIYAGSTFVDVDAYQGEYVEDTFTGTGADLQVFSLSRRNAAQNFFIVEVGGVEWMEDHHEVSPSITSLYEVITDYEEAATLRFSRVLGDVPPQNATIVVRYLSTAGEEGNIGSGLVTTLVSPVPGAAGLTVTNLNPAIGGKERESEDEVRVRAPRQLRTMQRAVTLQDFVDLLENIEGVAKAQAINHKGYAEIYVAPEDGARLYVTPPAISLVSSANAGSSLNGTYFVQVTAVDENGGETTSWDYDPETRAVVSNEQSISVSAGQEIRVSITNPEGAERFRVYVGTTAGIVYFSHEVSADASGTTTTSVTQLPSNTNPAPPQKNNSGVRRAGSGETLKNFCEEYLEERRLIGTEFALFNPTYVPVDITATVRVYDNYKQSVVRGEVETALADLFAFSNQSFGDDVALSDIYDAIMDVRGVRSVRLVAPTDDVDIGNGQIAKLGTVTLMMEGGVAVNG